MYTYDFVKFWARPRFIALALVFVFCLLTIVFVQLPGSTLLWRELQNTGHTILFTIMTLLFMGMIRPVHSVIFTKPYKRYFIAGTLLVLVAIVTELGQVLTQREPSLTDLFRDASGVLIGLGIYGYFDAFLEAHWGQRSRVIRPGVLVLTVLLLVVSFFPLFKLASAYAKRNNAFPLISDFQSSWTRPFMHLNQAVLTRVAAPGLNATSEARFVTQLELRQGDYPGISIVEPYPDWSAYTKLLLEIHSPEAEAFNIVIRIHDNQHNYEFADRFNQTLEVMPGTNSYSLPLNLIEHAPADRLMDMGNIASVMLFVVDPVAPIKFYPGGFRLE